MRKKIEKTDNGTNIKNRRHRKNEKANAEDVDELGL